MSTVKIFNAILLAVAVGLVAWGLTFIHVQKPAAAEPDSATVQAPVQLQPSTYTESGSHYDISVAYPATSAAERATMEAAFASQIADFKSAVADLDPSVMPSLADHKLSFGAEYKAYEAPGYTSYLYTVYEDTGGAHPNGYFKTFVFDAQGKEVTLDKVLAGNPNWLEELSLAVSNDVVAQMKQRTGQDDVTGLLFAEGLAPKAENFENFVIDGDTLVIEIPPYQVAAYAAGSFEVRLPLSSIDH